MNRFTGTAFLLSICLMLLMPVTANARKKDARGRHATGGPALVIEPDKMVAQAMQERSVARAEAMGAVSSVQRTVNTRYREGIDVSHYQGEIDWDAVAGSSQVSYAYLKATEGATLVDDTYARNLSEARRVGLSVGSYHFYRPNISWREQFQNLTSNILPDKQDLVPIIDIEHRGHVSEEKFISDLKDFVQAVEKFYGKKPLLYSYQNFYNRHLKDIFKGYPWMIAKYQSEQPVLHDGKEYIIWQYTSKGRIPGVKGNVDRSRLMGDFTLRQLSM